MLPEHLVFLCLQRVFGELFPTLSFHLSLELRRPNPRFRHSRSWRLALLHLLRLVPRGESLLLFTMLLD
jgi:hypothetical protein